MRESLSRAAVVDAARELLMSEGLSSLSLRKLASRLDVTAAALYAYVANKRDLLEAVIETEFEHLIAEFRRYERDGDPIERLCQMGFAYVRYAEQNPRVFRTMFMVRAQLPSEPSGNDFAVASRAFSAAKKPLNDAMELGLVRRIDPALAHLTLWTAVHGVATVLLLGPDLGPSGAQELSQSMITTLVRGLCTPRGLELLERVELAPAV